MTTTVVSSINDLVTTVAGTTGTNDRVLLAPGTYNNPTRRALTAGGSKVFVSAQEPLYSIITGEPIDIADTGIHFANFDLQYNLSSGNYVDLESNADGSRLSHCKIHFNNGTGTQHWIRVLCDDATIDHNEFYTKTTDGNMLLVGSGATIATDARVFCNNFHDFSAGGETFRIGASDVAQIDFNCEAMYNRFKNCLADDETITVKASNNNLHHNYMEDCTFLSQRHGHNNKFNDNVLVRAGLRLSGYGHEVRRNQVIENTHTPPTGHLSILNGSAEDDPGTPGTVQAPHAIYGRVKDCIIENNIFAAKNATSSSIVYLGYDTSRAYDPINNTIRNNIITATLGTLGTQSGNSGSETTHYNVAAGGDGTANLNSGSSLRYGIEAQSGSALVGDSIKTFKCRLRKSGTPSGNITATIRRASDDAIVATFAPTVNSTSLGTSFGDVTFSLDTAYSIIAGDRIQVEYAGGSTITIELFTTDQFDGSLTRRTRYQAGAYSASNGTDICGQLAGELTPPSGARWDNNTLAGNILWATASAVNGTIPGTSVDPKITQQADKTYTFAVDSPLQWTITGRVLSATETGVYRSFIN